MLKLNKLENYSSNISSNFIKCGLITIIVASVSFLEVAEGRSTIITNTIIEITSSMDQTSPRTFADYQEKRRKFVEDEINSLLGSDLELNEREKLANDVIMRAKLEEIENGLMKPSDFAPSRHLFSVLDRIKSSKLFKLIEKMPKGGALHAHDTALCNADYLLSLTYKSDLWMCHEAATDTLHLKFSREQPKEENLEGCEWTLISKERTRLGKKEFDKNLRRHFTLFTENAEVKYEDIDEIWNRFMNIFITVTPMLTYEPIWREYYYEALRQFQEDNVQYLELRGTVPNLYDLDGNIYSGAEVVRIYREVLNEFKKENPTFIGSKLIYAPRRKVDDDTFSKYLDTLIELKNNYPDFVVGFDLVAQEDKGRPLIDYAAKIIELPEDIKFFFHAGETNWYGISTDENLIDAVLLGAKRIGHGYAVIKHPKVLEALKRDNIAVEVNAISNQVLKLNDDNRNHPAAYLFANNYPVVVSSDDPAMWEATPLSHDFYIAFLGISSAHSDLRFLKKLALNSIEYSSLQKAEKEEAYRKWQQKWNEYIEWIIENHLSDGENTSSAAGNNF